MLASLDSFVCCPKCGDAFTVVRVGRVGVWGKKDSPTFKCTVCNITFRRVGGSTIRENMGELE